MTATGKNVYYDVLDDVVNEYNNTKHNIIKMTPIDVGDNTTKLSSLERKRVYIDEYNEKDSRFKELEYLNSKIYLLKDILVIGVKKYLLLIK